MGEQKTGTVFVRTKKDRNYTVIDNTFLRDDRLSAQAKGVFAYILYLPEDWCIYQSELVNHFSNGRDALRSAVKELEEFGYISKEHKKDEKTGRFTHWQYTVNEIPVSPKTDLPKTENPTLENPTLLNTDIIPNTNNTNSLSTSLKSEPPKFNPSSTIKKTSSCTKKTKNEMYEEYLSSLSQEERDESAKCVDMFIELHKHLDSCYNRDKNRPAWQVDFAKYHRKSTRLFSQIQAVMKYGMNDNFWKTRLSSPTVLFRAFETILQQSLETSPSYKSNRQKQIDDTLSRVNRDTGKSDYNGSIW